MVNKRMLIALAVCCMVSAPASAAQDPTAPLQWTKRSQAQKKTVVSLPKLPQLQSIICEGTHCSVILNDQVLSLGGRINGYTLIHVSDTHVTLRQGDKQWRLALFAENIRIN